MTIKINPYNGGSGNNSLGAIGVSFDIWCFWNINRSVFYTEIYSWPNTVRMGTSSLEFTTYGVFMGGFTLYHGRPLKNNI